MESEKFQELILDKFAKIFESQEKLSEKLSAEIQDVKNIQLRMETNLIEKSRGLFEFVSVQRTCNEELIERLDRIEAKVEVLQLETAHIRRVK